MAPHSINLCHLSSWSMHSNHMLSLLLGDITGCVAVLSAYFLDLSTCQEGSRMIHSSSFESCASMLKIVHDHFYLSRHS